MAANQENTGRILVFGGTTAVPIAANIIGGKNANWEKLNLENPEVKDIQFNRVVGAEASVLDGSQEQRFNVEPIAVYVVSEKTDFDSAVADLMRLKSEHPNMSINLVGVSEAGPSDSVSEMVEKLSEKTMIQSKHHLYRAHDEGNNEIANQLQTEAKSRANPSAKPKNTMANQSAHREEPTNSIKYIKTEIQKYLENPPYPKAEHENNVTALAAKMINLANNISQATGQKITPQEVCKKAFQGVLSHATKDKIQEKLGPQTSREKILNKIDLIVARQNLQPNKK